MKGAVLALLGLLGGLLIATPARAHMMQPQHGTLNVLGDSVFEVVAVPVTALRGVDDDGDGRLSIAEVSAHESDLQSQIGARFRLYDGDPPRWFDFGAGEEMHEGKQDFVLVRAEHDERVEPGELSTATAGPGARHVLALMKTRFPAAPRALRLETDLFGTAAGEGQLEIRATRGKEAETATLDATGSARGFFHEPRPTTLLAAARVERVGSGVGLLIVLTIALVIQSRRSRRAARRADAHPGWSTNIDSTTRSPSIAADMMPPA